MKKKPKTLTEHNTQNIINYFKGSNSEFYLLKGLLIASHNMNETSKTHYYKAIDTIMIAKRLDEINGR